MIAPTSADIGRAVVYRPFWEQDRPNAKPEEGVITSFSEAWVFVRYGSDKGPKATKARDLEWVAP